MLGATIRLARERAGISVEDLASQLNYSPSTLYQVEAGRYRPGRPLLARLVSTFKFSPDELNEINSTLHSVTRRSKPDRRCKQVRGDVITFANAARILDCDRWRIQELVQAGDLRVVDIRRSGAKRRVWRIPWSSIYEFVSSRTLDLPAQTAEFARYGSRCNSN